ncbi:hypothetical protein [Kitasatospora mediocidica]|uniref:hypothetical protein n=1 Tax=Kitasatospora mediocidica TaxID=58352 RepID=UPI00056D0618|nr:hypothetical protein [Kitasatospora mediocidica]
MDRFLISYAAHHYADEDWKSRADRWTASFYLADTPIFGTAVITRVVPGRHPNPYVALETDSGCLDRIPRVIFAEDGVPVPALRDSVGIDPAVLLLLESVEVEQKWRGTGVGMDLAVTALRHLAGGPRSVAVCYPAPIHTHGPEEPCSYESDDPEVRRPDEEAVAALRGAWSRRGFGHVQEGVYAMALGG